MHRFAQGRGRPSGGRTLWCSSPARADPVKDVKVWAHDLAQQEGRTNRPRGGNTLVFWWCSSRGKVASGQQRRSQGLACRGRTSCPRWSRGCWAPGGARLSAVSSGLRVAARRADAGDRPRARRLEAVGKGACGQFRLPTRALPRLDEPVKRSFEKLFLSRRKNRGGGAVLAKL